MCAIDLNLISARPRAALAHVKLETEGNRAPRCSPFPRTTGGIRGAATSARFLAKRHKMGKLLLAFCVAITLVACRSPTPHGPWGTTGWPAGLLCVDPKPDPASDSHT